MVEIDDNCQLSCAHVNFVVSFLTEIKHSGNFNLRDIIYVGLQEKYKKL